MVNNETWKRRTEADANIQKIDDDRNVNSCFGKRDILCDIFILFFLCKIDRKLVVTWKIRSPN